MDKQKFQSLINSSCTKETCYPSDIKKWSPENPVTGHCAIVALLVQDVYGGQIHRVRYVDGKTRGFHYFNIIDNSPIDFTLAQFSSDVRFSDERDVLRKNLFKASNVAERYEKLKKIINEKEKICRKLSYKESMLVPLTFPMEGLM